MVKTPHAPVSAATSGAAFATPRWRAVLVWPTTRGWRPALLRYKRAFARTPPLKRPIASAPFDKRPFPAVGPGSKRFFAAGSSPQAAPLALEAQAPAVVRLEVPGRPNNS